MFLIRAAWPFPVLLKKYFPNNSFTRLSPGAEQLPSILPLINATIIPIYYVLSVRRSAYPLLKSGNALPLQVEEVYILLHIRIPQSKIFETGLMAVAR